MDGQAEIASERAVRLKELKDEVARLREENSRLRTEDASLRAHFALALLAAQDFTALPQDGRFYIIDGWNLVLGDSRRSGGGALGYPPSPLGDALVSWLDRRERDTNSLIEAVQAFLAASPQDFAWLIFDGPRDNSHLAGRLRVSYTGGSGSQRADRMIVDFIRMARLSGFGAPISLITRDKELLASTKKLLKRRA